MPACDRWVPFVLILEYSSDFWSQRWSPFQSSPEPPVCWFQPASFLFNQLAKNLSASLHNSQESPIWGMLPLLFASNLPKIFCPFGSQLSHLFLNPPFLCVPSNFHLSSASLEQNWWQVSSHMGSRLLAPEGDMVRDLRLEEHLQADFKHLPVLCPEDSSLPSSSASQPSCTPLTRPFHNSLLSLRHFLERLHLPHAQPWGRGSPLYFYHVL